ncbi:glycosyltransferase family 4 protein [Saccharicrinis sp. GN24d3]|uniref:glycosyltransferase family 4 protein n=1 Tax=Saccharicrinis sp. GN24d3 TaxID=3458416 RepID=UPI0040354692
MAIEKNVGINNIVIFNKNVPAGVSTILKNIITYSNKVNYKLVLYKFREEDHYTINEDWCSNIVRINLSNKNNLYYTIRQLQKHITSTSIIVANDIPELRMCALLKLKNPLIYIIHGDFKQYYHHCEIFQDCIDLIIAYSSHIAHKLKTILKKENIIKIKLIYYPVPIIEANTAIGNKLNIIFAGSLTTRKGVDTLPNVIKYLNKSNIKYQFKIAGSGELENYLKNKLKDEKDTILVGQKSNNEIIQLFKESDILLFPTKSEGLPNVLIEAMKSGCVPVISKIESGIPDVVINDENGYLISPDKTEAFAESIISLYNNPDKLYVLKQNGIKRANAMFDPKVNALSYYESFIKTKPKLTNPTIKIPTGPILNKAYIPNFLVRFIRSLNINPNL